MVEKTFLHMIAINFHERALADRLAENRLGLKALDRLSNAQPVQAKKTPYGKKGHKGFGGSMGTSLDLFGLREKKEGQDGQASSSSPSPVHEKEDSHPTENPFNNKTSSAERKRRRKKAVAAVIVDQVGGAIGQVALKNSKFNREQGLGDLHSARKLARKLFSALSDAYPPRSHLVVEGKCFCRVTSVGIYSLHPFQTSIRIFALRPNQYVILTFIDILPLINSYL